MSAVLEQLMTATSVTGTRRTRPVPRLFLNEFEVEAMTGIPVSTLRKDRSKRVGMPYISMPRCIRYAVEDVLAFMASRKIQAEDKPLDPESRVGRPRKNGDPPNAATGIALHMASRKSAVVAAR